MTPFPIDYELPIHLIAQEPCEPRDHARLLTLDRHCRSISHHHFSDLPELLRPGDLLVLNDTRVLQARLLGKRTRTGGKWEGLFLRTLTDGGWEMLCQTRGTLQPGENVTIEPDLTLTLVQKLPDGRWQVRPEMAGSAIDLLQRYGQVPLPPYIRKGSARAEDQQRYQTIFAKQAGAVAAPTAGLHFTPRVFERLQERGIGWTFVTLHVGLGTFQPIQAENYTQHSMHHEWGELSSDTATSLRECRQRGGRIVAVGTTSVRVLETATQQGSLEAWSGETNLYIHPPYDFRAVDALITNFHLPRTTLLLLVASLTGSDFLQAAYDTAIASEYRFFSYGDAMLIV